MVTDDEVLELVELEMRETLESYSYDSESPIVIGSALCALEVSHKMLAAGVLIL